MPTTLCTVQFQEKIERRLQEDPPKLQASATEYAIARCFLGASITVEILYTAYQHTCIAPPASQFLFTNNARQPIYEKYMFLMYNGRTMSSSMS